MPLEFGLQIPRFDLPGRPGRDPRPADRAGRRRRGRRLPQPVGDGPLPADPAGGPALGGHARELDDPRLPGRPHRDRCALGTLVTGVTYRNIAHLAKIVATLDVLSGGRAVCGLGAAWFEREHRAYGWRFPPLAERYASSRTPSSCCPSCGARARPPFSGRTIEVAEAVCYPRPLQDHVPILVGGSGERRTLRLVARHADACNLFGDPDTVRHKVEVLHRHCADRGPRPGRGRGHHPVDRRRPDGRGPRRPLPAVRRRPACRP